MGACPTKVSGNGTIDEFAPVGNTSVAVVVPGSSDAKINFDKVDSFWWNCEATWCCSQCCGLTTFNAKRLTHPANIATSGKVFSKNTLQSTARTLGRRSLIVLLLDMSCKHGQIWEVCQDR